MQEARTNVSDAIWVSTVNTYGPEFVDIRQAYRICMRNSATQGEYKQLKIIAELPGEEDNLHVLWQGSDTSEATEIMDWLLELTGRVYDDGD